MRMMQRLLGRHLYSIAGATTLLVTFVALTACATQNVQSLRIDTRHIKGVQYKPVEMSNMLDDLGYERIPNPDPARAVENYEEYRMQFRARDASEIRIDVHIRMTNGVIGIHFYEKGKKQLGDVALQRYYLLKKRVEFQFGKDHVSENRPFLTP